MAPIGTINSICFYVQKAVRSCIPTDFLQNANADVKAHDNTENDCMTINV